MAYQVAFLDGFDHYDPGGAVKKWAVLGPGAAPTTTAGPHHGTAAVFAGGGSYLEGDVGGSVTSRGVSMTLRIRGATWGSATFVVPVMLLLVELHKQSLVVFPNGKVEVHEEDPGGVLLAESAPGAFPMDTWVHLCYSSALWDEGPEGRSDVFLDGTLVASATGQLNTEAPHRQTHQRIGNCWNDGNGVVVDVDDFASFETFETDAVEPDPPDFSGPHAVVTLRPVDAGDAAELGLVGTVTPNWRANSETVGDGDTSRVEKDADTDQRDLYRIGSFGEPTPSLPLASDAPDYFQYFAFAWGMLRDLGGTFAMGTLLVHYRDADDTLHEYSARWPLSSSAYRYIGTGVGWARAEMESLQVGYGRAAGDVPDGLEDAFAGSQVAVELWYPVTPAPPPAGGTRWGVGWVP